MKLYIIMSKAQKWCDMSVGCAKLQKITGNDKFEKGKGKVSLLQILFAFFGGIILLVCREKSENYVSLKGYKL